MKTDQKNEKKNLLVFGYGLTIIFAFIATRLWMKYAFGLNVFLFFVLAFFFLILTSTRLDLLKSVYRVWMKVAFFIGEIVSTLILVIIFYFLFTPIGLILRLLRKDFLDRKFELDRVSYWQDRKPETRGHERYHQQF